MRLDRIVVGVDFSYTSRAVARWVGRTIGRDAELILTHVLDVPRPPDFLGMLDRHERTLETARAGAEERLRKLVRALEDDHRAGAGPRGLATRVVDGRASTGLAELAPGADADLIAVGEHGDGGGGMFGGVGSTAEQVVAQATVPVLVARPTDDDPPRRMVVAVDDSDELARVLGWGRFLADRFEIRSTSVVHVLGPGYRGVAELVSGTRESAEIEESHRAQARDWLRDEVERAGYDPDRTRIRIRSGSPRHEILSVQQAARADLIVLGSRGAGAVERAFVGSVASAVLRAAGCSVLVVRGGADA